MAKPSIATTKHSPEVLAGLAADMFSGRGYTVSLEDNGALPINHLKTFVSGGHGAKGPNGAQVAPTLAS